MSRAPVGVVAGAIILLAPLSTAPLSTAAASPEAAAPSGNAALSILVHHDANLDAIAGTSTSDVWAVGYWAKTSRVDRTSYVKHWNGHTWKTVDSPYIRGGHFGAVAAVAPDDAWAVGASGYEDANLVEHWDGTAWRQVSVPRGQGAYNRLTDVSFLSADYVLAVGFSNSGEDPPIPTRLFWNGKKWTTPPAALAGVNQIDARSLTDAWGVGVTPQGTTLARHWDGSAWHTVKTPDLGQRAALTHVKEVSRDDVWATGQIARVPRGNRRAFIEHWDGSRWTVVDSGFPTSDSVATGISGTRSDDVWVSGYGYHGFLEHWDGTAWSDVTVPAAHHRYAELNGVAAFSGTDAWTVGNWYQCHSSGQCNFKRIVAHWDGQTWEPYQRP